MARTFPVAEQFRHQLLHRHRIELPAHHNLAIARPIELLVELAHVVDRHLLQILNPLIDGRRIARIAALIQHIEVAIHIQRHQRIRLAAALLSALAIRC